MSRNMASVFFDAVARYSAVPAVRDDHCTPPATLTYEELAGEARNLASGMVALGVAKGDRVGLLSDNEIRWRISDLGLLACGAVSVPRGSDTAVPEIWYILNHSEAVAAIVQSASLYSKLFSVVQDIEYLRFIVMMDDSAARVRPVSGIRVENFSDVLAAGKANPADIDALVKTISENDLATLVYTSGTTGIPKGVMLTHANLCSQCENIDVALEFGPGPLQLSILPAWHVYERMAEYFVPQQYGSTICYTDKRHLRDDMAQLKPHLLPCVPRIWESVYDGIRAKVRKMPRGRQWVFNFFVAAGRKFVLARRVAKGLDARRRPASLFTRGWAAMVACTLKPIHALGDRLVFKGIRDVTGGRMEAAVSGGGSLAPYIDDFFEMVGIPILNGYGLTEASPVLSARRLDHNVRGSVGPPIAGTEVEIRNEAGQPLPQGEAGVIWARGPQVMAGYYKNEQETRRVLQPDGWLNTGDLGWFSATGDLVISGRAKDTIVLLSGENIEPEPIECVLMKSPLIAQVVVVGQDKKVLGALVSPDFRALAREMGIAESTPPEDIASDPKAEEAIRGEINSLIKRNGGFKPHERISGVALLAEPFSENNGFLTQTLKPKRNVIFKRHAATIDRICT